MATVKHRNPPFLKVIFSLSVDIMKAKTQMYYEENRRKEQWRNTEKKHNKRKIKISKVKKIKTKSFISRRPLFSPCPLSPLLRIAFLFLVLFRVRFAHQSCVGSLTPLGVRSVLVSPKLTRAHKQKRERESKRVSLSICLNQREPKDSKVMARLIISVRTERDDLTSLANTRSKAKQMIYKYIQIPTNKQTNKHIHTDPIIVKI